jgi:hypothetical protein
MYKMFYRPKGASFDSLAHRARYIPTSITSPERAEYTPT